MGCALHSVMYSLFADANNAITVVPKHVIACSIFAQCLQQDRMLKERYIIEAAAESDRYLAREECWLLGSILKDFYILVRCKTRQVAVCVCSQGVLAGAKDLLFKYAARPSTRSEFTK